MEYLIGLLVFVLAVFALGWLFTPSVAGGDPRDPPAQSLVSRRLCPACGQYVLCFRSTPTWRFGPHLNGNGGFYLTGCSRSWELCDTRAKNERPPATGSGAQ